MTLLEHLVYAYIGATIGIVYMFLRFLIRHERENEKQPHDLLNTVTQWIRDLLEEAHARDDHEDFSEGYRLLIMCHLVDLKLREATPDVLRALYAIRNEARRTRALSEPWVSIHYKLYHAVSRTEDLWRKKEGS